MLSTLQRIASMMDAEEIDAAPVLAAGAATATSEDVSQFLDNAVSPAESGERLVPAGHSLLSPPRVDEAESGELQPGN